MVLVNGRRVNVSSFANGSDSFVNVNNIPMAAIERVDVLTDGASSVYGSDAIAGVINFILRDDYEGHELSLMYGDDTAVPMPVVLMPLMSVVSPPRTQTQRSFLMWSNKMRYLTQTAPSMLLMSQIPLLKSTAQNTPNHTATTVPR